MCKSISCPPQKQTVQKGRRVKQKLWASAAELKWIWLLKITNWQRQCLVWQGLHKAIHIWLKKVISLQMLTRQCDAKTEVWTKDVEWIWMQVRNAVVTLPMSPIMIKLKTTFSECWGLRADPQQGCGRTLSIFIRMLPWTKIWQETMPSAIRLQFKRGFQRTKILTPSNLFFVSN